MTFLVRGFVFDFSERLACSVGVILSTKTFGALSVNDEEGCLVVNRRSMRGGDSARALFVTAFLLDAVWEIAQTPWYLVEAPFSAPHLATCLIMALADATSIVVLVAIVRAASFRTAILRDERRVFATLFLLGALVAGASEHIALAFHWWSYGDRMPIIGGVGALPTLQLAILAPTTLCIERRLKSSSR